MWAQVDVVSIPQERPEPQQVFWCWQVRPIDGDTSEIRINKGHGDSAVKRLRLLGVDTPEMRGETREAGEAAKNWVWEWITAGWAGWEPGSGRDPFVVQTVVADSFGRWLGYMWRTSDGQNLSQALLDNGYAVERSAMHQLVTARKMMEG